MTPATDPVWPSTLWIVRHGQSAGNVARDAAEAAGLPLIDLADRDMDVPLSPLGERQADALGHWLAQRPAHERPEVLLTSPYRRARQTAQRLIDAGGLAGSPGRLRVDERLREKEFGLLDRLTILGIRQKYPELAEQRAHVGKFYFRPPGGESWCDVILRLRSVVEMICREHRGERVLIVAHQVTVNGLRYLLEELDEAQVLAIDRQGDVPNCGLTMYACAADPAQPPPADATPGAGKDLAGSGATGCARLRLQQANMVLPLQAEGAPVTAEPDAPAAPKP